MPWPSSCWRHAHKLFSFLRMHRNLVALQNLLLMSNKLFFFHFCLIYWGNLSVKYIECMFCWESVWENKSDLGFEQNLIPLGSSAQQRVFSQRAAAGRAAGQPRCHRCVTACSRGAHPEHRLCQNFPQHKHLGLRALCCWAFCTFQGWRGFFSLALSAPEVREGAADRKEQAGFAWAGWETVPIWYLCWDAFKSNSCCKAENEYISPNRLGKPLIFFAFWLSRLF